MNLPASQLSIVVPCYNEEAVIEATNERLVAVLEQLGCEFEMVYVDDGSGDGTLSVLRRLRAGDERVRIVELSRNFGHQAAVTAGMRYASGDAVVLIDADLQDPPEVIPEMVACWQDGYDVVYGKRAHRAGESPFKRWTAKAFYRLINRLSEVDIPLDTGDFRLMDRRVVDAMKQMPERDRFVRGMVAWTGFRQTGVFYEREARQAGETKYPVSKMLRFATDGILSFSTTPLRLATWAGFATSGLAVLGILYALVLRLFTSIWVPGWTALFIAVLFVGGMQLTALGAIGEYVGRIYGESKDRPLFLVRAAHGFETGDASPRRPRRAYEGDGAMDEPSVSLAQP